MLYEIVNMSDPYTIRADSFDVAFVACCLLGQGQYALRALEEGGNDVPLFLLGGSEEWCMQTFAKSFDSVFSEVLTRKPDELADCLDSCVIGTPGLRALYHDTVELITDPVRREKLRQRWHDERRSSLNDIAARAWEMARSLRKSSRAAVPPVTQ